MLDDVAVAVNPIGGDNGFTICVRGEEVLVAKLVSPPNVAVMELDAAANVEVVSVVCPALFVVPVPMLVVPS